MRVFVDTSAVLALMNANDDKHKKAKDIWYDLIDTRKQLLIISFVLLEVHNLLQNRLGLNAVKVFSNPEVLCSIEFESHKTPWP